MTRVTDTNFLNRLREVMDQYPRRNQAAHTAQVTTDQLSRYLRGASEPNFLVLARLCKGVGYSMNWLAFEDGEKQTMTDDTSSIPMHGLAETQQKGWYNNLSWSTQLSIDMKNDDYFAVIANGEDMIPEGIKPGTVCICSSTQRPQIGDTVYITRTDNYSALKIYQGQENNWIAFKSFLPPNNQNQQISYTDKIQKNQIKMIAPVIMIKKKL